MILNGRTSGYEKLKRNEKYTKENKSNSRSCDFVHDRTRFMQSILCLRMAAKYFTLKRPIPILLLLLLIYRSTRAVPCHSNEIDNTSSCPRRLSGKLMSSTFFRCLRVHECMKRSSAEDRAGRYRCLRDSAPNVIVH